ncbi:MAG TPA: glycosyltransferase family 2 protein [Candidatus Thermoplasmatota archaeon]|nr:glycosyltransferase family 2 protein [Candidatus Thermoplasmatota archaeon]
MRATVVIFTHEQGPLLNLRAARREAEGRLVLLLDASRTPARQAHVRREAARHDIVRIPTPGASLAAQRNVALARADAPAVAFLDDDCLPRPGWLAALEGALDHVEVATARVLTPPALAGPYARFFDQDHGPRPRLFTRADLRILPDAPFEAYAGDSGVAPWAAGTGSSFACRVDAARRVGGFREDLGVGTPALSGEDVEFFFRALHAGGTLAYVPAAQVEHHHVRRDARDFLRTAYAYAWGGREFLRRAVRLKPGYAVVLLGRPVQLLLLAAKYRAGGDAETAAMCLSAFRGWVGLPRRQPA